MKSDADLVRCVLSDQRDAYETLVQRYERSVRAVVAGILHDLHAAQDAVQDTFVSAYEKLGSLRNPDAFGPWILSIARHQALRAKDKTRHAISYDESMSPANGKLDHDSQTLLSAVMKLPENEQQVVLLKHFEFLTINEIAAKTGRPTGTVTKQLSRAYARLRNHLKETLS